MNIYYERVNQRYRGPFEKEKLAFLLNQVKKNIQALYVACEKQKLDIKNLQNINEAQGFDFEYTADPAKEEQVFEDSFRAYFNSTASKSLSHKEKIRDLTVEIESFVENARETLK